MSRTIMISSTFRDLEEYREEVHAGCDRIGFNAQHRMEGLGAENADAVEASLKMVEEADIYICFLGHRYGYQPPGSDISITEMEYNKAVELDKPRLVFFIDEDHPFPASRMDRGADFEKLQAFKKQAGIDRVANFFTTPKDLRSMVVEDLGHLDRKLGEEAGEDPVKIAQRNIHRNTTIPAPPEPYIAHPYTLMQSRRLVGRQKELGHLTDWITDEKNGIRIFNLVAIGGMGKSALAWKFFNEVVPNERNDLAGRLWWSFYESDADFLAFMVRALAYLTGEDEKEIRKRTWDEIETPLLAALNAKPYLLVLDGLERILIAYSRMDAAHLKDDDALDETTANRVANAYGLPATAAQSFIGKHRLRLANDPRAGSFLRKLLQSPTTRTLITTRLYPTDLQAQTGDPLPNCLAYFQKGLSDEDALELWRDLSIKGSSTDLRPIFQSVEGHPLLVQALAAEVANYRPAPGDFATWRAAHPRFDPALLPLTGARSHILDYARRGLNPAEKQALEHIVAFRMPASYNTLAALLVGKDKPCTDPTALDEVLTALEDRGLIGWDKTANRYDAHPIVRGVVWSLTGKDSQTAVLTALDTHFEPMDTPDQHEVESLADLAPAIERYNSLVGLERLDDAFDLFSDRLARPTLFRLAAHRERIELLQKLFQDLPEAQSSLLCEDNRQSALHELAMSYEVSGQPRRAVRTYRAANSMGAPRSNDYMFVGQLTNIGNCLRMNGSLKQSEQTLIRSLKESEKIGETFNIAITHEYIGILKSVCGKVIEAEKALTQSETLFDRDNNQQALGLVAAARAQNEAFRGNWSEALDQSRRAWTFADIKRYARDYIRAGLCIGLAQLGLNDLEQADEFLHAALTRARGVNAVEFELAALVALARLSLAQKRPVKARAQLDDVWDSAREGPHLLDLADAYNTLTEIEIAEGNTDAAIAAATEAYKHAWCDGPPYAYHWGLEAAKKHLDELKAPYPDLPPFDESKFEPLPEVELILDSDPDAD